MVVECFVCCLRKIVKFFGDIKIINASMSNKYNVKIIIVLCLWVTLFQLSYKVKVGS